MADHSAGRRSLLISSVAAGTAILVPTQIDDAPPRMERRGKVGDIGDAVVPPAIVNLAEFGGTPGAGRIRLIDAFNQAFAALTKSDGGTLLVPAGVYDFGRYAEHAYIILCRNLRNVAISAYGATFMATTSAKVTPNMFYFFNFYNITIAGASFIDPGFNAWTNWQGMYCVGIQADRASSGFRLADCYAERVVGLLGSNNNAASRNYLSNVSVQGEVRYSYYGVGVSFIRENVNVELVCHNVRRALVASSLKNANIVIFASSSSNWSGSNGLVSLATSGASSGNVENVRVQVDVSGACIHSAYIHFYHQGHEVAGYMRNIDATVNVIDSDSTGTLFLFDHEIDGVQSTTRRTWDRISLHGTVSRNFRGCIIVNTSVPMSPGVIYLDRHLAQSRNCKGLGASCNTSFVLLK